MGASGDHKEDPADAAATSESVRAVASDYDATGTPVHRGWAPLGARRRWMEPFVLVMLAGGGAYGYSIIGQLEDMGITGTSVDVGQVYRTLRDLEEAGHVTSQWSDDPSGPRRREYRLTETGYAALDEWAAVMKERTRLIGEFDAQYFQHVTRVRS